MTTSEEMQRINERRRSAAEETAKAAWISGFQAARHWPNHGLPELTVEWNGPTLRVVPDWQTMKRGWVG